jgi:hypothetical protein
MLLPSSFKSFHHNSHPGFKKEEEKKTENPSIKPEWICLYAHKSQSIKPKIHYGDRQSNDLYALS